MPVILLCLIWQSLMARAQGPLYPVPTDRFGVGLERLLGQITDYDVTSLNVGWYSDWGVSLNPPRPGGIEYVQLIWVDDGRFFPSLDQLGPMIDANLGSLWLIGNEPERVGLQGNCTPEQYAVVYHDLHTFIKARDPTARVAIGGVVQATPLRLKWLDRLLNHYQTTYDEPMPVDVWNIHEQILQELQGGWGAEIPRGLTETSGMLYTVNDNDNINIFKQHIVAFRTWMRDRGERDKPLIISEYGVLFPPQYGYTTERVNGFMNASFDYLLSARDPDLGYPADENRLVQRWLWYSLNDQPYDFQTGDGYNGALFDYRYPTYPGVITDYGINFKKYTDALLLTPTSTPPLSETPTSTPTGVPNGTATPSMTPSATAAHTLTATPTPTNSPTVTPGMSFLPFVRRGAGGESKAGPRCWAVGTCTCCQGAWGHARAGGPLE